MLGNRARMIQYCKYLLCLMRFSIVLVCRLLCSLQQPPRRSVLALSLWGTWYRMSLWLAGRTAMGCLETSSVNAEFIFATSVKEPGGGLTSAHLGKHHWVFLYLISHFFSPIIHQYSVATRFYIRSSALSHLTGKLCTILPASLYSSHSLRI